MQTPQWFSEVAEVSAGREPYHPAWRRDIGVMLGNMVAVAPGGAEYLSRIPLDLFEIPVR